MVKKERPASPLSPPPPKCLSAVWSTNFKPGFSALLKEECLHIQFAFERGFTTLSENKTLKSSLKVTWLSAVLQRVGKLSSILLLRVCHVYTWCLFAGLFVFNSIWGLAFSCKGGKPMFNGLKNSWTSEKWLKVATWSKGDLFLPFHPAIHPPPISISRDLLFRIIHISKLGFTPGCYSRVAWFERAELFAYPWPTPSRMVLEQWWRIYDISVKDDMPQCFW